MCVTGQTLTHCGAHYSRPDNLTAFKNHERSHDMKNGPIDKAKLAKTDQEYTDLLSSRADWIARTADDVRQLRQAGDCPLAKLPENDFKEFSTTCSLTAAGLPVDITSH
jgi:hypothetical protein